jgi:hypothetical protein
MLMVTLWALQRGRWWLALPAMLATLGFSPLAFLFLVLALLAVASRGRRLNRTTVLLAVAVAAAGGAQLGLLVLLPTPTLVFPYGIWRMLAGLVVAGLGAWLSLRGRGGWPLASLFLVWAAAGLAFELVPSPVGRNILRASVFVFPLMLVAAARAGWRPRWLALTACAVALASNVLPYTAMISDRSSSLGSKLSFWQPTIRFLDRHERPGFRVEVVETANHWENYFLPEAGFPLARGWYVQLFSATRIAGRVSRPGVYLLRVAFNPYWKVERGSLCLSRAGKGARGATLLHAHRAGRFAIRAIETPQTLVATIARNDSAGCRSGE